MISMIIYLAIGYAIAVLFPMPFISQAIINGWAKIWAYVKSKVSSTPTAS
jgi:hypothetical protein